MGRSLLSASLIFKNIGAESDGIEPYSGGYYRYGKLSLYPLKFEEAVKGFLEVKPQVKIKQSK